MPGVDRLIPLHDGTPDVAYDVDVEVMELPYVFRTVLSTTPRDVPYLEVAPLHLSGAWPRIGLAWRAGEWDSRRSIDFSYVGTLLDNSNVSWYSLQLDIREDERHTNLAALDTHGLLPTARAMRGLDLVISIDSMPAHLAGALGVPVWTLLVDDADWRWMEERSDSPWYPTMRLFRQPRPGDWCSVVEQVREALAAFVDERVDRVCG